MDTIQKDLETLIPCVTQEISRLRKGDNVNLNNINRLMEGFWQILKALYAAIDQHTLNIASLLPQAGNAVQELADALQNKDYVVTADMLEYELLPLLENWQQTLSRNC